MKFDGTIEQVAGPQSLNSGIVLPLTTCLNTWTGSLMPSPPLLGPWPHLASPFQPPLSDCLLQRTARHSGPHTASLSYPLQQPSLPSVHSGASVWTWGKTATWGDMALAVDTLNWQWGFSEWLSRSELLTHLSSLCSSTELAFPQMVLLSYGLVRCKVGSGHWPSQPWLAGGETQQCVSCMCQTTGQTLRWLWPSAFTQWVFPCLILNSKWIANVWY